MILMLTLKTPHTVFCRYYLEKRGTNSYHLGKYLILLTIKRVLRSKQIYKPNSYKSALICFTRVLFYFCVQNWKAGVLVSAADMHNVRGLTFENRHSQGVFIQLLFLISYFCMNLSLTGYILFCCSMIT